MALLPLDIDPFGHLGPFFHHFLSDSHPTVSLHFPPSQPNACAMYSRIMTYPSPNEILTLTDHIWKNSPPCCFFGHSYTSPTPTIHASEPQSLSCQSIQLAHTSCHPAVQWSYLRLLNQKVTLLDLAGRHKRTKFWFKNLMGQFSILPIIRLVFVWIFLLSERILLENAVVGSWAQLWLVRSKFPRQKWENVQ